MSLIKICLQCQKTFEIFDDDLAFLEKLAPSINGTSYTLPPPTLCPECRLQRRLAHRNERNLYHRKCSLTGKQIIASYSEDKPFPVYDNDVWFSDAWDPLSYGRDFDFSRPFFEQFAELRRVVPRMALVQQKPIENSEYSNCIGRSKNCYLMFSTNDSEDCYYGTFVNFSKNCVDNINMTRSELCYDCVICSDSYNLQYCRDCTNCKDSYFLRNCSGCRDCFGCSNLVNQQFCIYNEQKTEKEYREFIQNLNLGSYEAREKIKAETMKFLETIFVKAYEGHNLENAVGNYLHNCKNTYMCFEMDTAEDCKYCTRLELVKDCMDYTHWGANAELIYETHAAGYNSSRLAFCNLCWSNCSELLYCDHSFSSKNCFGSIGLKNARYVILNKQYSKGEYEQLAPKIIEHMRKTGEWGEFFPLSICQYAYNESVSSEYWTLTKEQTLKRNWQWYEEEKDIRASYQGPQAELSDHITQATESVTHQIYSCKNTGKLYRITPQELRFYKEHRIPLPRLCPDERHKERLALINRRELYERSCSQCKTVIFTGYNPSRPEEVLCESCYHKRVYG